MAFDVGDIAPSSGVEQVSLDELLAQSDVVTLHAPPSPDGPLLDASRLNAMKDGAVLINTARGALVDNVALCALLASGKLSGVGADVFAPEPPSEDDPLLMAPNVFLTPHVAAWNAGVRVEMVELALSSLSALFEGGRPDNVVNPEVFDRGLRA